MTRTYIVRYYKGASSEIHELLISATNEADAVHRAIIKYDFITRIHSVKR